MDDLDSEIQTWIGTNLPTYRYIPPLAFCPVDGPQALEGKEVVSVVKKYSTADNLKSSLLCVRILL